jgi:dihydrofolate reductase
MGNIWIAEKETSMRKIVVLTFVTLDGIMQAPGGPEEDGSGAFRHGGWSVGYWDQMLENLMSDQMGHPFDMLLGRITYDLFAGAWPKIDPQNVINTYKKYVVKHQPLPADTHIWKNSVRIDGDVVAAIRNLKIEEGLEIQVHGSSNLIQTLLKYDLIDELWLKIYPLTLGQGKRLFGDGTIPAGFDLIDCKPSQSGVILAKYRRAGEIKFGSFAIDDQNQQEVL